MPGTIHAIVGENGAGKSTLMKILYGAHRPDEGTHPRQRHRADTSAPPGTPSPSGIGMVFQHFMLADNLTVWENIVLGDEPGTKVRIDIGAARKRIRELGRNYGLDVDPDELVAELGVGEQAARRDHQGALPRRPHHHPRRAHRRPRPPGGRRAVRLPARAGRPGVTVIFISHKLDEVLKVADAITVIRAGRTVAEVLPSEVTARDLAELMVGSELPTPETRESTVTDQVALAGHRADREGRGRPGAARRRVLHRAPGRDPRRRRRRGQRADRAAGGHRRHPAPRRRDGRAGGERPHGRRHAGAPGARDRLHPAGPPARRPGAHGTAVGERHARAPDPATVRPRVLARPRWGAGADEGDHRRVRRAHARPRGGRARAVRRQPAEADRRAGDDRRTQGAHRRAPHPRHRRRRAGRHLGRTCGALAPPGWPSSWSPPTWRS